MYIEYGKYSTYFTHLLLYIKLHILLSETTQTDSTCHCYRPDEQLSAWLCLSHAMQPIVNNSLCVWVDSGKVNTESNIHR